MGLANDVCRCFGHECVVRQDCARHRQWKGGERTPRVARLCAAGTIDSFIQHIKEEAVEEVTVDEDCETEKPYRFDHLAAMHDAGHKPSDFY